MSTAAVMPSLRCSAREALRHSLPSTWLRPIAMCRFENGVLLLGNRPRARVNSPERSTICVQSERKRAQTVGTAREDG